MWFLIFFPHNLPGLNSTLSKPWTVDTQLDNNSIILCGFFVQNFFHTIEKLWFFYTIFSTTKSAWMVVFLKLSFSTIYVLNDKQCLQVLADSQKSILKCSTTEASHREGHHWNLSNLRTQLISNVWRNLVEQFFFRTGPVFFSMKSIQISNETSLKSPTQSMII